MGVFFFFQRGVKIRLVEVCWWGVVVSVANKMREWTVGLPVVLSAEAVVGGAGSGVKGSVCLRQNQSHCDGE